MILQDYTTEELKTELKRRRDLVEVEEAKKKEVVLKFTDYIEKQAKAYDINLPHRGYDIYAFAKDLLVWVEKQRDKDKFIQKLNKQKYTDNAGTKFYEGEWVVFNASKSVYQVEKIEKYAYALRHILGGSLHLPFCHDDFIREWTIQDAKDGDVLVYETDEVEWVLIYKEIVASSSEVPHDLLRYYFLLADNKCNCKGVCSMVTENYEEYLKPATKEQRDLLFTKMKEAGYEWNTDKKELKKIELVEQKPTEEANGEDYGIDSLYHAQRILEKTLGKVDGYQSDDGILEHKCAISAVKKLYEQKTDWNREDEQNLNAALGYIDDEYLRRWLKDAIYNRYENSSEWSEEDT